MEGDTALLAAAAGLVGALGSQAIGYWGSKRAREAELDERRREAYAQLLALMTTIDSLGRSALVRFGHEAHTPLVDQALMDRLTLVGARAELLTDRKRWHSEFVPYQEMVSNLSNYIYVPYGSELRSTFRALLEEAGVLTPSGEFVEQTMNEARDRMVKAMRMA